MVLLFYIVNGNIVPSELKVRSKSLKGTSVTPLSSYFLVMQVQLEQGAKKKNLQNCLLSLLFVTSKSTTKSDNVNVIYFLHFTQIMLKNIFFSSFS